MSVTQKIYNRFQNDLEGDLLINNIGIEDVLLINMDELLQLYKQSTLEIMLGKIIDNGTLSDLKAFITKYTFDDINLRHLEDSLLQVDEGRQETKEIAIYLVQEGYFDGHPFEDIDRDWPLYNLIRPYVEERYQYLKKHREITEKELEKYLPKELTLIIGKYLTK